MRRPSARSRVVNRLADWTIGGVAVFGFVYLYAHVLAAVIR